MQRAAGGVSSRARLRPAAAVALVTAGGAAIRIVYASQPMRYDEAATWLYYSSKSALYALVSYTYPNNHVFHTLLVSASTFVFGNHPWAIRLPALVAGVAMIPLTYLAARRYGEVTALFAAAFVASSSVLIEFSTNARGYTIVASIFLGLIALMPALMRNEARAWRWFPILGALGFFTIPTMLFPFGIVVCWLGASIARTAQETRATLARRFVRGVLATAALVLAAYLPAILWSGPHAVFANHFVRSQPWHDFTGSIGGSLRATWLGWNRDLGTAATIAFAVLFVAGIVRRRVSVPAIAILWCGTLLVAARWVPFHRVWTFLIPVYWIAVAAGLALLVRRSGWVVPVALAICIAIGGSVLASGSVLRSTDTGYFPDAERVALSLRAPGTAVRVIASPESDAPLEYYARLDHVRMTTDQPPVAEVGELIVVDTAERETLGQLARRFGSSTLPASTIARARLVRSFAGARVYIID